MAVTDGWQSDRATRHGEPCLSAEFELGALAQVRPRPPPWPQPQRPPRRKARRGGWPGFRALWGTLAEASRPRRQAPLLEPLASTAP